MASNTVQVLVVEDEPELAELFEIWLGEEFDVKTITRGAEALEIFDEQVDVLLLDWRMPEVSGEEILTHIRSNGFTCQIAVVTGLDPEVADITGADLLLRKPVEREELVGAVTSLAENATE